jgi:hypothetical protein
VQTHFFDSDSAAAVGGQEWTGPTLFARLSTGGRKVDNFETRGAPRRGDRARQEDVASQLCGEEH